MSDERTAKNNQEWATEVLGSDADVNVVDAVANLLEEKTIYEIDARLDKLESDNKDKKERTPYRDKITVVAGEVFERVALNVLEKEIGEPDNPKLSEFLVNVMRSPRDILGKVQERLENGLENSVALQLSEKEITGIRRTLSRLAEDIESLPKHPRNSDAIAYKSVDQLPEQNPDQAPTKKTTIIEVTGAYEMKGYKSLLDKSELTTIGHQIEDSRNQFYKSFEALSKYYDIYRSLCATSEERAYLPDKLQLVDKEQFETVVVVPSNTSGVQSETQIADTMKTLSRYGCTSIRKVGIKTQQIGEITNTVMKKVQSNSKRRY